MILPASVTPFDERGRIDFAGVAKLLAWFESAGCEGVVLAGTNGEGPSLSAIEKRDLVLEAAAMRSPLRLVLGVASASLDEAIYLTRAAGKVGASVLLMPPAYFREASVEGVEAWLRAVMDEAGAPVILYNYPQKTGFTFGPELVNRLSHHPNCGGLKDSSGARENLVAYRVATPHPLFMGDETLLPDALMAGWNGAISGAANVLARGLVAAMRNPERWPLLMPALRAIRTAPQPGTHKAILHAWGVLARPDVRLPLLPPSQDVVRQVVEVMGPQ